MKLFVSAQVGLVCVAFVLAGCNQHTTGMFAPQTTAAASSPMTNGAVAGPVGPAASAPYVVRAQSGGPYIDFSIFNMGTTDLEVKKEHFALIDQENRDVTPYDKGLAIIDLPQPAVVKPNETLHGRAIFKNETSPVGKRLVFKPDSVGTFADINRISAMNGAAMAPPVGTSAAGGTAAAAGPAVAANAPAAGGAPAL